MNIVVLCGRLTAVPSCRQLPDGGEAWSFDVSSPSSIGTLSAPVVWSGDDRVSAWVAGTELLVVGSVRRRFFRLAGVTQSRTEVVARHVSVVGPKGPTIRAWRQAWASLGGEEIAGLRLGLGALPGAST